MSLSRLAKKVGVSREVAGYRIKRLKQKKVISKVVAKIDASYFYQQAYAMYMRFSTLNDELLERAISYFVNNPYVMWVGSLVGEYDLGISFLTQTPQDLTKFMKEMDLEFGNKIKQTNWFPYDGEIKNTYKVLFTKEELSEATIIKPKKVPKIDDKDKILLYALSRNAEIKNRELAELVGLSEEAVRLRKRNYEKKGIITGYRGIINLQALELSCYYTFLRFDTMDYALRNKIETYVKMNQNIYYCANILGYFNVLACIWAKNPMHFQQILQDLRNKFSENLTSFRSQLMFNDHKHTYLPEAALNVDLEKVNLLLENL